MRNGFQFLLLNLSRRADMKKSELKTIALWFILMAVFIFQLLFYTWCRVQCTQAGYEISKQTGTRLYLITQQNNLRIELARLKSPERIAGIAKNQLGLTTPAPEQMVVIP